MWHGGNLAIIIAIDALVSCKKHKHRNEMRWNNVSHKHGKPKHGRHKWQMRNKKKMVHGDVCVSVMNSNLCQQWWPFICVNNDGPSEKVLAMASLAHNAYKHSICWRGNLTKELTWRIISLWWRNIGDGDHQQGNVTRECQQVLEMAS
jgi:hypothetical protein